MSKPKVSEEAGSIHFVWEKEQLGIKASRLHQHTDGRVTGELKIVTTAPTYAPHLHQAQFNFAATRSRKELVLVMAGKYPEAEWEGILEQVAVSVLERVRRGEPLEEVDNVGPIEPIPFLLRPLIPEGFITTLFGDAGVGKSTISIIIAVTLLLPWENNPLGLIPKQHSTRVLILDWESDRRELEWRLKALTAGMGLPYIALPYRRCHLPLAADLEAIHSLVRECRAEVVIIDSLGAATGGDLNKTDMALAFFSALRSLRVTPVLLAHNSKDPESKRKTIFGSQFFTTYSRSVWEVLRQADTDDDSGEINLGLFHRKSNPTGFQRPLGIHIAFDNDEERLTVMKQDAKENFLERFSLSTRILELLKGGVLPINQLTEELEAKEESVSRVLRRLKGKGVIVKLPDGWGLATKFS